MQNSSGVAPEVLPLPKGGGAVRSIGETFSPDVYSGTGSYRIPIWFPHGPGSFQPEVGLVYSSGAGNGPFGLGWHLPVLRIARRSDRGTPHYDDRDTFLMDGQELVPIGGGAYRLHVEGEFRKAERVGAGWRVTDRSGRVFELGTQPAARVEDSTGVAPRVLAWLVERATDTHGNTIDYSYRRDGAQLYLDTIRYGPYELRFSYAPRPDPFTDRRSGFALTTGLRCETIAYHLLAEAVPFYRYTFAYEQCAYSGLSLLATATCVGNGGTPAAPETATLPVLRFRYTPFEPGHLYQPFRSAVGQPPPEPVDSPGNELVDMRAEGLPGVITARGPVRRYWPNRTRGVWGPPETLRQLPAALDLADGGAAFADMDGSGSADVLILDESPLAYLPNLAGQGWVGRARFRQAPSFDPADPELRLVDLNGDGLVDALRTGPSAFYCYINRGAEGWAAPTAIARLHDKQRFPDLSFSDPRVKLADMTGDGLVDIVWVHAGRIDYWPSLGDGRFGERQILALPEPIERAFDPARLLLADINGDGVADVLYVERDRVRQWINRGGASLRAVAPVRHTPHTAARNPRVADMLGTGVAGLLWSLPFAPQEQANYKYLDFTGGVRPYLLAEIDNGLGMTTEITYQPSTEQAEAARQRGTPWATTLPFPVQLVGQIVQRDAVSGSATTRSIRYYDGLFDGTAREFRGFGRAEVIEEGDVEAPSTLTVSCFHQGRAGVTPGATAAERAALKGRLYRLEVFGVAPDGARGRLFRAEDDGYAVRTLAVGTNGRPVLFPHLVEATVQTFEGDATPLEDRTTLSYDDHGNIIEKRERWASGDNIQELVSSYRYTADTARWILGLPVEWMQRDGDGKLLKLQRFYYDGAPFVGLPLGQVASGNLSRREQMAITDAQATDAYAAALPPFAVLRHHRVSAAGQAGWAANILRQQFDARGNVVARMDGFGNIGRVEFDADGIFPRRVTDPLGRRYDTAYDLRAQQIVRISDPNGHETRYRFDPIRRMVAMIKPGDSDEMPTTRFVYLDGALPFGVRTQLRAAAGGLDTIDSVEYFDGFSRRIQLRAAAEGGQVLVDGARQYCRRGWESMRTAPFFSAGLDYVPGEGQADPLRSTFRYDALGRIIEAITPDGRATRTTYNKGQHVRYDVSDTDDGIANMASGHFDTPRIERHDARGRLIALTEQNSGAAQLTTRYTYDPLGNLLRITDPRSVQTAAYQYDLVGRKIRVDHVDAGTRRAVYDARGDLAASSDAAGQQIEIAYDATRRQTELRVGGVVSERYQYDSGAGANLIGRLARVEDEAGETRFSYTARGLVAEETRQAQTLGGNTTFTTHFGYDAAERMVSVTHPGGAPIGYHYNPRGLLDRIDGVVDAISYNAQSQATRVRYANGVEETNVLDPTTFFLRRATISGPARATPYYDMTYTYDAVGNPLTISDGVNQPGQPRFQRACTYDALGRLTGVSGTLDGAAFSRSYAYDDAGNFRQNEELRPEPLFVSPGGSNQIRGAVVGGVEAALFAYSPNGEQTATPDQTHTFDARGRLVRIAKADGTLIELAYTYRGERARKRVTVGGATSETLYIGRLYQETGGQASRFVFNEGVRVAEIAGGQIRFFHRDQIGNVVMVTDAAGAIVRALGYFPFGTPAFSVGPAATAFQFIGNELDAESGLVYCRSRYYDPRLGRFITPDLFVLMNPERTLGLPAQLNLYAYAGNNPLRLIDDEGGWWKWLVGGLIIAALVVATIVVGVATGGAGFAFGILLAASIGSALGAGVGTYSAWRGGGDLADGFLFGAIVGGAAGAAGYAAGAAIGAAGISGVWGSILGGAAQGALIGAGNGAILGYAGGAGSVEDVLIQAGIGFGVGAVLGGAAGAVSYASSQGAVLASNTFEKALTTPNAPFWGQLGGALDRSLVPVLNTVIQHTAHPIIYTSLGTVVHAAAFYDWDPIKAWLSDNAGKGEEKEVIVKSPEIPWG